MMDERNEIQVIKTFHKDPRIHVYYKGCGIITDGDYKKHNTLEDAKLFMIRCWGERNPTIIEYKHPEVKERLVKITLIQARELAEVAANNMGAPFGSLAKILLANFTLDELRPQEAEQKEFKGYEQLKQEDFMVNENRDIPREISLEEAKAIWKSLPHGKPSGWTPAERFTQEILLHNFKEEALENKSFTWKESFSGNGYEIVQDVVVEIQSVVPNNCYKRLYKTREQAESALAFAQLSHIVEKYNQNQTRDHVIYKVIKTPNGELTTHDSTVPAHLEFYSATDAETSLKVNEELWKQYWMIK